ncbi:MAG: hypothetical protein AUG44_28645 [Actinobacteria bacterium 13_1_20CM_3_71_11]|nr:MAG: hypothetical protein AUG44_28645 [Actinobacteria bacterium 13_1_20CM_3_71_11]
MSPVRQAPRALSDPSSRARYVSEVLALLFPETPGPATEFVLVPNATAPRLLVPVGSRRVASGAVRRYAQPATRTARIRRDLAALALRTGADRILLRDRVSAGGVDTIATHLAEVLDRELSVSVHIGPARANRKPVLQLLSPDGDTIGFAKIGVNRLTRRLVLAETTALTTLRHLRLSTVVTPRVLYAGRWRRHQVLVQEALPAWQRRYPDRHRMVAAMREVAGCLGVSYAPLSASGYWKALQERLSAVDCPALAVSASVLADRRGGTVLGYGAWHGDWAPWNTAVLADSVLVWDWERFTPGVPLGFDAVHHGLQVLLERGVDAAAAVDATVTRAPELVAPFGVPAEAARVTALLYLVDLATRYLTDKQAEAGARLGVLGSWLLPVLIRRVGDL